MKTIADIFYSCNNLIYYKMICVVNDICFKYPLMSTGRLQEDFENRVDNSLWPGLYLEMKERIENEAI